MVDTEMENPPARVRRPVETPEYAAFVARILRAYGRRVADADDVDLGEMYRMSKEFEAILAASVAAVRARGESWAYIASEMKITPQAAHKRWRDR